MLWDTPKSPWSTITTSGYTLPSMMITLCHSCMSAIRSLRILKRSSLMAWTIITMMRVVSQNQTQFTQKRIWTFALSVCAKYVMVSTKSMRIHKSVCFTWLLPMQQLLNVSLQYMELRLEMNGASFVPFQGLKSMVRTSSLSMMKTPRMLKLDCDTPINHNVHSK